MIENNQVVKQVDRYQCIIASITRHINCTAKKNLQIHI